MWSTSYLCRSYISTACSTLQTTAARELDKGKEDRVRERDGGRGVTLQRSGIFEMRLPPASMTWHSPVVVQNSSRRLSGDQATNTSSESRSFPQMRLPAIYCVSFCLYSSKVKTNCANSEQLDATLRGAYACCVYCAFLFVADQRHAGM